MHLVLSLISPMVLHVYATEPGPAATIELFNGKDLTEWYAYTAET